MKTYFIKLAFQGVSPMIWRRFAIPEHTSLAQLHQTIQVAYGWDDDYLHQFHIYGKDYGISYMGGVSFSDDANQVFLEDFDFDVGDKFTYEYIFFNHWVIDIRIEAIKQANKINPICCLKGKGMLGANQYDELEPTINLLKAIANANESTTLDDIRPYVDALNAVRFNRHQINHDINTQLISST